jgi:hypothetical protein
MQSIEQKKEKMGTPLLNKPSKLKTVCYLFIFIFT